MNNSYKSKLIHQSPFNRKIYDNEALINMLKRYPNHGLCGSINLGNTCFMNSSIACISNCYELTYYFLSKAFSNDINRSNRDGAGGKLAEAWYELIKYYWNSNNDCGNPKIIKSIVGSKNRKFSGYNQQDSNEFMTVFLEILGEDLNKAKKKVYRELQEQQKGETDVIAAKRFWDLHVERNDNIITDLFHGLFKCTVICPRCNFKNITYDPFNTLALNIPSERKVNFLRQQQSKKRKKSVEKVKKQREKEKIIKSIYCVPEYSLRGTVRYEIEIYKSKSLDEIAQEIRERSDEKYFPLNPKYFSIETKKCVNILDNKKTYKNTKYIFSYANESKNVIGIPIYISYGEELSSYPRALFFNINDSYYELKKKIYILVRKYLKNPFSEKNKTEKFTVDINLDNYINEKSNNLQELLALLESEYNSLQRTWNSLQISEKDIPYKIYLSNDFDKITKQYLISEGINDKFDLLSQIKINSKNDKIDTLIELLLNNSLFLCIKLNPFSRYVKRNLSLNKCTLEKCTNITKKEYEIYYEEIEKMDIDENESENHYLNSNNITLDDCLLNFTYKECLEEGNEWYCNKCRKKVSASKTIELFYLPRILCICLTRFIKTGGFYNYSKNNKLVEFPLENLNMENYMCGPDKKYSKYDLFAVSQHYGGMHGGHYTAVCKNIDGKWYDYDDSSCSQTSKSRVISQAAYVLFYRRKDW